MMNLKSSANTVLIKLIFLVVLLSGVCQASIVKRHHQQLSSASSSLIHLHDQQIDTTVQQQKDLLDYSTLLTANQKHQQNVLYIVHVRGPVTKDIYQQLGQEVKNLNGAILNYIPDNSYLVTLSPITNGHSRGIDRVQQLKNRVASIQWMKALEPRSKVSPIFKAKSGDYSVNPSAFSLKIHLVKDLVQSLDSIVNDWNNRFSNMDLLIESSNNNNNNNNIGYIYIKFRNNIKENQLNDIVYWISTQHQVFWIEPYGFSMKTAKPSNFKAHLAVQSGSSTTQETPLWDLGILGNNEIIGCGDTGIDTNHCYFYDAANPIGATHRKIVAYGGGTPGDSLDGHGTHIAGTILGSPSGSNLGNYQGGAPAAKLSFVSLMDASTNELGIPSDISAYYSQTYQTNAKIHCDAWNSEVGPYYTDLTAQIDQFQYENPDFLVIRSAGNTKDFEFTSVYTVSQEATSKNSLVVGSYNQDKQTFVESAQYMDYDNIYADLNKQVCTNGKNVYGLSCTDVPASPALGVQDQCCNTNNNILLNLCCANHILNQYQTNATFDQYQLSTFSGRGPTSDGRIKPDIIAPGSPIISSRSLGASSTADHCGDISGGMASSSLVAMQGTSQAAATMAAAAALVRQFYREGWYTTTKNESAGFNPSASLIKATLINSADPLSIVSAFSQGFGAPNLSNIIKQNGIFSSGETKADPVINTHDVQSLCFQVTADTSDISITLVWTDPQGIPLSPKSLVNNLDLMLTQYVDFNVTGEFLGNGQYDDVNNVEKIVIKSAPRGRYDAHVLGTNVPIADQTYSLVIHGDNIESLYCSECYYDPNTKEERECAVSNGIGTQVCGDDNLFGKCKIYACDSGYVLDNGITKSCVTMLALTLYNIVLLAAFGIILVISVFVILMCYKSKSLDKDKYHKLKKSDDDNGGNNNNNNKDSTRNGKTSINAVEMGSIEDEGAGQGPVDGEQQQEQLEESEGGEVEISLPEIISLGKPESHLLAAGLFLAFVDIALGLAIPLVSANIFDLLYSGDTTGISEVILTFALIIIGSIIVQFIHGVLLALAGHKIIARLRKELFDSILAQDMAFFNERKTGELMSRLAVDVSSVRSIISDSIPSLITQVATVFGSLIMVFIISWKLSLVVLCPLPVLLLATHFYGNYIEKISIRVQDALADAATHAAETLFNIKTVRWFSAEQKESYKFAHFISISYKIALKMTIWNGIYGSTSGIFEQLSLFILLWYGASLVNNGELTPSMLIAFNLFLPFITGSLTNITSSWTTYKGYKGSSYRFFEIMQRIPAINTNDGIVKDKVQGNLDFKNVSFIYPGTDAQVLKGVNLSFRPGTITALIGPSGGGKSTMLSLIGRLYNINEGQITLDGVDIKDWNVTNLHEHVSIVNQEPSLFTGTIADNVMYGKPNANRSDIINACKMANAHDFITALPDGYDTLIGERGTSLSGGQKQRIAIARTIIKNPTVLLMDEATSELDVESEHLVQDAIDNLISNRTVIIVAHRLSTILTADTIAVVSESHISEMGTPEELLALKGMFYEFVQIQYGKQDGDDGIEIQLPRKNTRNAEKLRMRSETIKRVVQPLDPQTLRNTNLAENDQGSSLAIKRPPSPPMWRKAKKHTTVQGKQLLNRQSTATNAQKGWQKGQVEDKLQRVLQKSRKKGFFNGEERKDIKGALLLY